MLSITEDQCEYFEEDLEALNQASSHIPKVVEQYHLPNPYKELLVLIERQSAALTKLLKTGELDCELTSLTFDQQVIHDQHTENMAALAQNAKAMTNITERETFFQKGQTEIHKIKGVAEIASDVFEDLKAIMNPAEQKDNEWTG